MKEEDYSVSILVDQPPNEVFDRFNNVRGWWSGQIDGVTNKVGEQWTYRYQDLHRSTQKITELDPGKRVVWHVVDSHLSFVKDPKEWNGTDIVFDIRKKGAKTELRFTHKGLAPSVECYDDCSDAWGFYIKDSLKNYIATGKGTPNPME